ncbi:MAG: sugar phosphate isomerase/epimerase [Kiritimatiellae bacterium]|nr:sugar phosphate isomerase/epimerase [Kiritimatiellia bacterium]
MRFALSTNWNNDRLDDGAAIADEALALGFDALELGFRTQPEQLDGFRRRLDQMPVDSIHAYCPVPLGAPSGHPELHRLASRDADERALARILLEKTLACAKELGARAVVTHAGYVDLDGWIVNLDSEVLRKLLTLKDGKEDADRPVYKKYLAKALARRRKRGRKLLDIFRKELDILLPDFQKAGVTLALENLPRLEGFPDAEEAEALLKDYAGAPVRLWFDTGHARVRECHKWSGGATSIATRLADHVCGMHLNDVKDFHDDHRQPGWGNVDFAALAPLAKRDVLRVFEPHLPVTFDELKASLASIRKLWA